MIRTRRQHPDKPVRRHTVAEWAGQILILLFGYTTVGWTYVVPTGSMENTLMVGDHLIVDHLVYAEQDSLSRHLLPYSDVKRGDIIVFRYPLDPKQTYVKRAIGVPGDHIRIVNKQVMVNGHRIEEPYKRLIEDQRDNYLNNFPQPAEYFVYPRGQEMLRNHVSDGELVVPPGQYFAMGDNRDNSSDSRFWGFVPRENIIGKPVIVFWSYEATTEQLSGRTYWVDMVQHFFTKTRWRRTLHPVRA